MIEYWLKLRLNVNNDNTSKYWHYVFMCLISIYFITTMVRNDGPGSNIA